MYTTKGFYKNCVLKFIETAQNIEKSYDYYLITIRTQRVDVPDPFDRLIIARAISENLPIISANE
jgi:PIN domain nuclease of toxin-antitoxin system